VIGADTVTFHPTATDRDLNINASGSFTSSFAFKFGSVVNGSTMSGTLYLRCVAGGIPFDINKTIVLGDNLVDLGTTAQLASLAAKIDLTAKEATLLQTEADIINAIGSGGGHGGGGGGGGLTLAQIEASTVLAKEATVATRASQTSVNAIPINPLLTNDIRLDNIDASVSSRASQSSVNGIPTNPLLTNDARLNNLDATISSRLATSGYTAPANADIVAIKAKTDQISFSAGNINAIAQIVNDKTGYSLTSAERQAIATAIELAIINEADGRQVIDAIVQAIGNENITAAAIAAQVRTELATELARIDVAVSSVGGSSLTLANIEASTVLAKEATVASRASQSSLNSLQSSVDSKPSLASIEASTILAKEATTLSRASQLSVNAIPTNTLASDDPRLDTLDATISSRLAEVGYQLPPDAVAIAVAVWNNATRDLTGDANAALVTSIANEIQSILAPDLNKLDEIQTRASQSSVNALY